MNLKRTSPLLLLLLILLLIFNNVLQNRGTAPAVPSETTQAVSSPGATISPVPDKQGSQAAAPEENALDEDGVYDSAEDVALFIHTFQRLPRNYITKAEARKLGWSGGDLRPYAREKTIGGDPFGNYEGLLPKKKGRVYHECDIDTLGKSSRGAKRIVYSNDGLIYYTDDHYESFVLLYGEE